MKKISFCTTCKGRLWQLKQTLPKNIDFLNEETDLIILDYQSPDGLKEWLEENYKEALDKGFIKYFRLLHPYNFYCAYAKNVAHRLAQGDVLFNLDADGFINETLVEELRNLKDTEILVPRYHGNDEGSFGRLGYTKETFYKLNGYSENIIKMQDDDGNLRYRATFYPLRPVHSRKTHVAVQNTPAQKELYTDVEGLIPPPNNWPKSWGVAEIEDRFAKRCDLI